jgi:uncharacterized membrane protein YfcA
VIASALSLLPRLPALAPWQWLLGGLCAFFVGVAKTGVPGFGILVVPFMVLAVGDARHAAGWLLPLLCAGDVFAVAYYRRHAQARRLFSLTPWVLVGMAGGAVALGAPERLLRPLVGAIVLVMIALHLARQRRTVVVAAEGMAQQASYGAAAGFATMVANAAGPVMNAYLLAKRLPKEEFIATGAWFFLVINLVKLPVYGYHHLIDGPSLIVDAMLLPALAAGALFGRAVFRRIPQRAFDRVVLGLTAVSALLLVLPPLGGGR